MTEGIADDEGTTSEDAPAPRVPVWRRKPVLLGAVAVVVVAITAVVIVSTGSEEAPARPKAKPAPTVQPLRLSTEPLWTSPGVEHVEELDGQVLMRTLLDFNLVDATTGKPGWTLQHRQELAGTQGAQWQETSSGGGTGLRHLVRHGDGVGVLIEYRRWRHCKNRSDNPGDRVCFHGPGDEDGLALLSGVDGSVVWQTPIISPHPADTDHDQLPSQVLRAVDDRMALVSVVPGPYPTDTDQGTSATIAIDVRTGQKLWERSDGMWPNEIVGDVALGEMSKDMPGVGLSPKMDSDTVMALELATGHPRWDLSDRYEASKLVSIAGGVALVHGIPKNAPEKREFAIVDAATGREITKFPSGSYESCDTDGRSLITCLSRPKTYEFTLTSYDVENRAVRTTMTGDDPHGRVVAVWANRAEVVGFDQGDSHTYTVDVFGNRIDKNMPGRVAAIRGDRALLFVDEEPDGAVAMYRVLD